SQFPEPERFRPERFSTEEKQTRPRGWYLPFGAGPRVCIGSHFALLEAQLALATIAGAVRLTPLRSAVEPEPLLTLRPRGGLPMRIARR
ncbi:cytochrome P450, partial [Klebsiella pneumoniae]|uniref:cytochrome P450 n=1 Tax=Klebsiella pneumoniae TaxID=573 RepID=UPI002272049F